MTEISGLGAKLSLGAGDEITPVEPAVSKIVTFEDILAQSEHEEGSAAKALLDRIGFTGELVIPEPTISLREFIGQIINTLATIISNKSLLRNADLQVLARNLENLEGSIERRIDKFTEDAELQIAALTKEKLIVDSSSETLDDQEVITSDQSSTTAKSSLLNDTVSVEGIDIGTYEDLINELGDQMTLLQGSLENQASQVGPQLLENLYTAISQNLALGNTDDILASVGIAQALMSELKSLSDEGHYYSSSVQNTREGESQALINELGAGDSLQSDFASLESGISALITALSSSDEFVAGSAFVAGSFTNLPDYSLSIDNAGGYRIGQVYVKDGQFQVHTGQGSSQVLENLDQTSIGLLKDSLESALSQAQQLQSIGAVNWNSQDGIAAGETYLYSGTLYHSSKAVPQAQNYNASSSYSQYDLVKSGGTTYMAKQAISVGDPSPPNSGFWKVYNPVNSSYYFDTGPSSDLATAQSEFETTLTQVNTLLSGDLSIKSDLLSILNGTQNPVLSQLQTIQNSFAAALLQIQNDINSASSNADWLQVGADIGTQISLFGDSLPTSSPLYEVKYALEQLQAQALANGSGGPMSASSEMSSSLDALADPLQKAFNNQLYILHLGADGITQTYTDTGINPTSTIHDPALAVLDEFNTLKNELLNVNNSNGNPPLAEYVQRFQRLINELYIVQKPLVSVESDGTVTQTLLLSELERDNLLLAASKLLVNVDVIAADQTLANENSWQVLHDKLGAQNAIISNEITQLEVELAGPPPPADPVALQTRIDELYAVVDANDIQIADLDHLLATHERTVTSGTGVNSYMIELRASMDRLRAAINVGVFEQESESQSAGLWDVQRKQLDAVALGNIKEVYEEIRQDLVDTLVNIDKEVAYFDLADPQGNYNKPVGLGPGPTISSIVQENTYELTGFAPDDAVVSKPISQDYESSSIFNVSFLSSAMSAATGIVEILQNFDLFFNATSGSVATYSVNDQPIEGEGARWGGTMMEYATWGRVDNQDLPTLEGLAGTGNQDQYVQHSQSKHISDYYAHFTSSASRDIVGSPLTATGGVTSKVANPLAEHANIMYEKSKDFFFNVLKPSMGNYSASYNELLTAVEQEVRFIVSESLATSAAVNEGFLKLFENTDIPEAERQLIAKMLNMLLSMLAAFMSENPGVRNQMQRIQAGVITVEDISSTLTIGSSVATRLVEKALEMASKHLEQRSRGDLLASDTLTGIIFADLDNFFKSNQESFNELERREKDRLSTERV